MNFKIKINPHKFTTNNKPSPHNLIRNVSFTISNNVCGYADTEFCYGFVFHKVRRKTKQTKTANGKTKSTIIRKAHWNVSVYKIPIALLKIMGVKLIHKARHFELKKM